MNSDLVLPHLNCDENCNCCSRRICDIIADRKEDERPFVSFEFYPPKTEKGAENLMKRMEEMHKQGDIFMDMTWGSGGSTSELTLELCKRMCRAGINPNMHLTCTGMVHETIDHAILGAKDAGIMNILALRGDPPKLEGEWKAEDEKFTCALDLVKHIRECTGDHFCITVSAYPEGHPDKIKKVEEGTELTESEKGRCVELDDGVYVCSDEDFEKEMAYVVQKVEAGANMIITQMVFDAAVFFTFVKECRARGVTVPIIPGFMIIKAAAGFTRMTNYCKSRVPQHLKDAVAAAKDDKEALNKVSVDFFTALLQEMEAEGVAGFHFYTLNIETNTYAILDNLNLKIH
eukprot:m.242315 g.242315  ORF g.242315 m.242315 type:complete len:346 (-) comp32340_c0_seq1:108-1145(-)